MSSASIVVTAKEMSSLLATVNCGNAAFTILVYDWLLCLDQELALIWNWKTRRTIAPIVYVLTRYMPIVQNILAVTTIFPMSFLSCEAVVWVEGITQMLSLMAPAVFSAIRTYALSEKNYIYAITAFLLSIVLIVSSTSRDFKFLDIQVFPAPFNCSPVDNTPERLGYKLTMIARACLILADLIVIVVTWLYTYNTYKIQKSLKFGSSLGSVMLYNGSLYFMVLASLNVLQMILATLQIDRAVLSTGSYVTIFLDPISYILICHFLLNLRQVDRDTADPSLRSIQDEDLSVQFAGHSIVTLPAFIGSFGGSVHTSSAADTDLDIEGDSLDIIQNASAEADGGSGSVEVDCA